MEFLQNFAKNAKNIAGFGSSGNEENGKSDALVLVEPLAMGRDAHTLRLLQCRRRLFRRNARIPKARPTVQARVSQIREI